jgi:aminoglycoside phosphotransferase family enzyme
MSDESKLALRSAKIARIIENISEMFNVSLQEATDIYYNSETANLIDEGVADLHCRSEKYLAEEVWLEHQDCP